MTSAPVLYGPDGLPIRREVLTQEIAAASIGGVRSPLAGYPADGLNPSRLASILKEADAGDPLRYYELAELIEERDLHYAGVLGTRKRQVSQLDVTVEAASDDVEHKRHADTIETWLKRDELQEELFDILDAVGKGESFTEIVWDTSLGQWQPKRLIWRDPRWFRPRREDLTTPMLRGDAGDAVLPPFKFIHAVIRAKSGLPIRSGIARLAAWWWMFKAFTQRDWAIFTQTFGQPIRVGKYPPGATEGDKSTLFNAVANIAGDCAAIIPQSMLMEFIESANVGQGHQLYKDRSDWLDRQMSKAVLGQTSTTDAEIGGLGSGDTHREVQEDIERADAKTVSAIINRDLVRAWIDLEFGPQRQYPRVRVGRSEEKNIDQIIKGIEAGVPMGMKVEKSYFNDLLGVPVPKDGAAPEDLLIAPVQLSPFGDVPFGAPGAVSRALHAAQRPRRAPDAIEQLAREAQALGDPGNDEMIDALRRAIDGAKTFDELKAALEKLELPKEKFIAAFKVALVMTQLAGRDEAADA